MSHINENGEWLDSILGKVFNAGVGFERGQSMMQQGHLKMTPDAAKQAILAELHKREAAYGGCHNCYGKGYATVNDRWAGYDTDQDIGSPGGYVSGGDANAMKFCTCDRGRQLKAMVGKREAAARVDEAKRARDCIMYDEEAINMVDERIWELKSGRL
jgi:hypothetical protein